MDKPRPRIRVRKRPPRPSLDTNKSDDEEEDIATFYNMRSRVVAQASSETQDPLRPTENIEPLRKSNSEETEAIQSPNGSEQSTTAPDLIGPMDKTLRAAAQDMGDDFSRRRESSKQHGTPEPNHSGYKRRSSDNEFLPKKPKIPPSRESQVPAPNPQPIFIDLTRSETSELGSDLDLEVVSVRKLSNPTSSPVYEDITGEDITGHSIDTTTLPSSPLVSTRPRSAFSPPLQSQKRLEPSLQPTIKVNFICDVPGDATDGSMEFQLNEPFYKLAHAVSLPDWVVFHDRNWYTRGATPVMLMSPVSGPKDQLPKELNILILPKEEAIARREAAEAAAMAASRIDYSEDATSEPQEDVDHISEGEKVGSSEDHDEVNAWFIININSKDGRPVAVKVRAQSEFDKIAAHFREQKQLPATTSVRFEFDGDVVEEGSLIGDLEIEDGECLDAFYDV